MKRGFHQTEWGSGKRRTMGWHGKRVQDLGRMRTVGLVAWKNMH